MNGNKRSWDEISTKPVRLRIVNCSSGIVDCKWVPDSGVEQSYRTLKPSEVHVQSTFSTHVWHLHDVPLDRLLLEYVGGDATIELVGEPGAQPLAIVHEGWRPDILPPLNRTIPPEWGSYRKRGEVHGLSMMAWDCVCDEAIGAGLLVVGQMLSHTPEIIIQRMVDAGADIAIIGRHQVVSDIPPHDFLRGADAIGGERTFDHGTRGVGGNWTVPTCSAGEENLCMIDDPWFHSENILVHEFGHSVMDLGCSPSEVNAIKAAYNSAMETNLYDEACYMASNSEEYWAEGTQSWFDATVRTDVNSGVCTRELLKKHDPELANILKCVYGEGMWRYPHSAPVAWQKPPMRIRKRQRSQRMANIMGRLLSCSCLPRGKLNQS